MKKLLIIPIILVMIPVILKAYTQNKEVYVADFNQELYDLKIEKATIMGYEIDKIQNEKVKSSIERCINFFDYYKMPDLIEEKLSFVDIYYLMTNSANISKCSIDEIKVNEKTYLELKNYKEFSSNEDPNKYFESLLKKDIEVLKKFNKQIKDIISNQ